MPRVYTTLLKVTRIRLRIIATDCTWSTSFDVEVLIFVEAQVSVTFLVKVLPFPVEFGPLPCSHRHGSADAGISA